MFLKQQIYFLTVRKTGNPKIKVSAVGLGELFSWVVHCVLIWSFLSAHEERENEQALSCLV